MESFCCISLTGKSTQFNQIFQMPKMRRLTCSYIDICVVPRSSLTTAHGQSSGHGAGDLLIDQRISEDDFTVQQYKANFPQLHYPPIRKPKEGKTDSYMYIGHDTTLWKLNWRWLCPLHSFGSNLQHQKSSTQLKKKHLRSLLPGEKIALESDFKSIMDGLDSLRKKQETEIESQLDKDPKSDLLLRDTIRAKVTELCSMHPHRTMTEINTLRTVLHGDLLDEVKERVLKSHLENLNILLHQVDSLQSRKGSYFANSIPLQLQEFIFQTVDCLYRYDMIPASMVREFFAIDQTLEVAVHNMIQRFVRIHYDSKKAHTFQRSNFFLEDPSFSHFRNLFDALEAKEHRRSSWLSDKLFMQKIYRWFSTKDEDLDKLILEEDDSFLETLEAHVDIMLRNKTNRINEESPYLQTIDKTIENLLKKTLTLTDKKILKVISMIIDFIVKNYADYDIMEFSKRASPIKEAFKLRYASLDLIEELVRIENYLSGLYQLERSGLKSGLNGKTKSELTSQVGLIDSYIKISYEKHTNLISRLCAQSSIFHNYSHLEKFKIRTLSAQGYIIPIHQLQQQRNSYPVQSQ
ncbi:hypothetical protein MJO29_003395, partial [Puccinia striiformis f. sp. tritici]